MWGPIHRGWRNLCWVLGHTWHRLYDYMPSPTPTPFFSKNMTHRVMQNAKRAFTSYIIMSGKKIEINNRIVNETKNVRGCVNDGNVPNAKFLFPHFDNCWKMDPLILFYLVRHHLHMGSSYPHPQYSVFSSLFTLISTSSASLFLCSWTLLSTPILHHSCLYKQLYSIIYFYVY